MTESTTAAQMRVHAASQVPLPLLHIAMLLSGFGTVFLGPVLPALAASTRASDSGSGLFFTAQFLGAFFGGITTSQRLYFCLLRGLFAATAGFALLAFAMHLGVGVAWSAAALLPLGFGVGQMLTSINLLVARQMQTHRTAALSLVNFTWSLGAVLSPFLLGSALAVAPLTVVVLVVVVVFAAMLGWALAFRRRVDAGGTGQEDAATPGAPRSAFLSFAAMLLVYGGVETAFSGWITTFGTRYGNAELRVSSLGVVFLWIGITGGRALVPLALRVARDRVLLLLALGSACLLVLLLMRAGGAAQILVLATLLGLALSSWFPLVLSSMLAHGATARQTGIIIALSGIGAATLPLLLGVVSRLTGSLRIALTVPLAGLLVLTLLAVFTRPAPSPKSV